MIVFLALLPISLILEDSIELEVIEAEAALKGQTATSSYKPAKLENEIRTLVPPHIIKGDKILINTNDGSYIRKSKNK